MEHLDPRWAAIWCIECRQVTPLLVDFLPAGPLQSGGENKTSGLDLVCGHCKYIVVTLHEAAAIQVVV